MKLSVSILPLYRDGQSEGKMVEADQGRQRVCRIVRDKFHEAFGTYRSEICGI